MQCGFADVKLSAIAKPVPLLFGIAKLYLCCRKGVIVDNRIVPSLCE